MNALSIRIFVIAFFAVNSLAAQGDKESFVFAEYCIHFDSGYRGHGKNGIWKLARTEQLIPMPSIKINVECSKNYFRSTDVGNIGGEIVMGTGYFKEMRSCAANYNCGYDINEEYKIDEDFENISTTIADSAQTLSLIGKIFSFKWDMHFTCESKELYNLSGIFDVKISGICNEEQLKKIEKNKNNKEIKKDE